MLRCVVPIGLALAPAAIAQPTAAIAARQPTTPGGSLRDSATLWDQSAFDPAGLGVIDQEFADEPAFSTFLVNDISTDGRAWNVDRITTWFTKGFGVWDEGGITWGRLQVFAMTDTLPTPGDLPPEYDVEITLIDLGDAWAITADTSGIAELQGIRGQFWVGLTPAADFATFGQEYHLQTTGEVQGVETALRNPGGALGIGTSWKPWTSIGGEGDAAILLEGQIIPAPAVVAVAPLTLAALGPRRRNDRE
jgi:hypothetical protein